MSVYLKPNSPYYQYDFMLKGRRFYGSTGVSSKRSAQAVERRLRIEAAEGRLGEAAQMSLDEAAGKWWSEVGAQRGDAEDVERRLAQLLKLVGKDRRLADISTKVVSDAIQRRRAMTFTKSPKEGAKSYAPSNATVNRDVIDTLRPILRRAELHWEAKGLPKIAWGELRLGEPRETVRVYSKQEQMGWIQACGPEASLAVELMLTYGMRFGELFFALDQFEPEGPRLAMTKGRKWDVPHTIPLREEHARQIAARVGRARAAGLPSIWFVEEEGSLIRPLTYYGLQARIETAADKAGIKAGRRIHGARHHAGTAMLRATGNVKLAQRLLGHADIKSTMRYVHAVEDDLREAIENVAADRKPKSRKRKRN